MRRPLLAAIAAAAALVITAAIIVGVLLNNAHQSNRLTGQDHPTACGALAYAAGRLMTATASAQGSATCFAHAVSVCHAASLSATVMGVDTGQSYSFAVSGGCQAAVTRTLSGITVQKTSETVICQGVSAAADALQFTGCGDLGDISLPTTRGAAWPNA